METVDGDIREQLADWVTAPENAFFARNWANRFWSYFMGRGLVEPVDDLRLTNPASMPALLDALADEFVRSGYDARQLIRTICTSQVYQRASEISPARDEDGAFHTHHRPRRLSAQVLADAIDAATGIATDYEGLPAGTRAIQLPDPKIRSEFLNMFGRSQRANPCECASTSNPDLAQALYLINSEEVQQKVSNPKNRAKRLLAGGAADDAIFDQLYLRTLSRLPTDAERQVLRQQIAAATSREEAFEDLLWSLLNSSRFVFQQ